MTWNPWSFLLGLAVVVAVVASWRSHRLIRLGCLMSAEVDRLSLATRTMTARRYSTCDVCCRLIIRGDRIARLINPAAWVHIGCVPVVARLQRGEWPSNRES
jgi:hypothetical protein